jgi:hypothetical protein
VNISGCCCIVNSNINFLMFVMITRRWRHCSKIFKENKKSNWKKKKFNQTKANDRHIAFTFLYWLVLVTDDVQSVVYSWSEREKNRLAERIRYLIAIIIAAEMAYSSSDISIINKKRRILVHVSIFICSIEQRKST